MGGVLTGIQKQKLSEHNPSDRVLLHIRNRSAWSDHKRKVVITVVTEAVNKSCWSLMARRKGAGDEYVVQVMLNHSDTLGMVKAELKCDLEPSTMEIARVGEPMQNHGADRERNTTRIEGQAWPR